MNKLQEIKHTLERLSPEELISLVSWAEELSIIPPGRYPAGDGRPPYTPTESYMTPEEYFEFEKNAELRHEYVNGYVYARSGSSLAHVRITGELLIAFETHLRGRQPCEAFATQAKLWIHTDTDDIVYYPDLVVACNREEWGEYYVCNPKLVIEVLSPSTKHIDRREKAMTYRRVASIEEYALLKQDEHELTLHRRAEAWKPHMYSGPQAIAEFRSVGLSVPLSQIYADTLSA
jgi:Uma2 family endonuclease